MRSWKFFVACPLTVLQASMAFQDHSMLRVGTSLKATFLQLFKASSEKVRFLRLLIPPLLLSFRKKANPSHFGQFRPISLCNFLCKIISKTISCALEFSELLGMKILSLMSVIDSPMLVVEMKSLPTYWFSSLFISQISC